MARKSPIAILGHAGHGKTALIEALSKIAGDQTFVEVTSLAKDAPYAFSLSDFDKPIRASIATMKKQLAGARAGILVVDVDGGPGRGTRVHVELTKAARLRLSAIALNKIDLCKDKEIVALVELEVRALLDEFGFKGDAATVVRVSATSAAGLKPKLIKLVTAAKA